MGKRKAPKAVRRAESSEVLHNPSRKFVSLLSVAFPCLFSAIIYHLWSKTSLAPSSCKSTAKLDSWKASLFKRVMTLSKDTDFRAQIQKEPEGHLRFSLFEPFDSCAEGSLTRVGGEGDGTSSCCVVPHGVILTSTCGRLTGAQVANYYVYPRYKVRNAARLYL